MKKLYEENVYCLKCSYQVLSINKDQRAIYFDNYTNLTIISNLHCIVYIPIQYTTMNRDIRDNETRINNIYCVREWNDIF